MPRVESDETSRSIFDGVDELIDRGLGVENIGNSPHHKHLTSCRHAISKLEYFDASKLVADIYDQIGKNWDASEYHNKSNARWRLNKQRELDPSNSSPEVVLEREIVRISPNIWPEVNDWFNQVPVASGLVSAGADRRRAIDLVHKCGDAEYELIELKIDSDTPLYAAMEILKYGLLYCFCRQDECAGVLTNSVRTMQLFEARRIHLQVFAPANYYEGFDLYQFEMLLSDALANFVSGGKAGFEMDFKFMSLLTVPSALEELRSQAQQVILSRAPTYFLSR